MRPAVGYQTCQCAHSLAKRTSKPTLDGINRALGRVDILDILPLILSPASISTPRSLLLLALERVVRPPVVRLFVSEHARREAVGGGCQFVAAELGEGGVAAGADDEHLLLAPFARLARHCDGRGQSVVGMLGWCRALAIVAMAAAVLCWLRCGARGGLCVDNHGSCCVQLTLDSECCVGGWLGAWARLVWLETLHGFWGSLGGLIT
jgi:hypothetical protein